jgi:hypothetical protein
MLFLIVLVTMVAGARQERPPAILEIYRDTILPGQEARYRQIEEDATRVCAELKCPNPHLAIESLSGPKEVWWLNAFDSPAHKQQVEDAYLSNRALLAALQQATADKPRVTGPPVNVFADYMPGASRDRSWPIAGARYFVVTVTRSPRVANGVAFDAPGGARYIMKPVHTQAEADAAAAAAGEGTRVFAVRPYYGRPAKAWIAADPEFWKDNPSAK